jgi:hypothetical protein
MKRLLSVTKPMHGRVETGTASSLAAVDCAVLLEQGCHGGEALVDRLAQGDATLVVDQVEVGALLDQQRGNFEKEPTTLRPSRSERELLLSAEALA